MSIDNNTTIEQKETEEKFKTALSDFFGITEGGEINSLSQIEAKD